MNYNRKSPSKISEQSAAEIDLIEKVMIPPLQMITRGNPDSKAGRAAAAHIKLLIRRVEAIKRGRSPLA